MPDRSCGPEQQQETETRAASPDFPEELVFSTSLGFRRNGAKQSGKVTDVSSEGCWQTWSRKDLTVADHLGPRAQRVVSQVQLQLPEGQLGDGSGQGLGPLIASEGRGIAWHASSEWACIRCNVYSPHMNCICIE